MENKAVISNVKKKKAGNHNSRFVLTFHQDRHDIRFDSLFISSSLSIQSKAIIRQSFFYSFAHNLSVVEKSH